MRCCKTGRTGRDRKDTRAPKTSPIRRKAVVSRVPMRRSSPKRAKQRGQDQLGTLGAGNHFIEVDRVNEIYDDHAAGQLGLHVGEYWVAA